MEWNSTDQLCAERSARIIVCVADVAIDKGRFVRIGKIAGRGRQEIDARDRYVSPGWIDVMDQSGSVLPRNGLAENKLRMGVTTAIGGEGGTPVPAEKIPEYFACPSPKPHPSAKCLILVSYNSS